MDELQEMRDAVLYNKRQRGEKSEQFSVRKARSEDSMDVLRWRNDPVACAMSRHHEKVSVEDHAAWYPRAISGTERLLFIGILKGEKVGVVRFDRNSASLWEVSITLAAEARGQNLGRRFLTMALEQLNDVCASTSVLAVIRVNNKASLRLFQNLGFKLDSNKGELMTLILTLDSDSLCF